MPKMSKFLWSDISFEDIWKSIFYRLFFFNPDYHDDAPEKGVDALELVKQSEQSLKNLLDLKEEADIDDENILLEIDSHLHSSKKKQGFRLSTNWIRGKY